MISIKSFEFNPFMENTYVVSDSTGEAIIIDPGCYEQSEKDALSGYVNDNSLKVVKLVNTHCHIDHVLGNEWAKNHFQIDLFIHEREKEILESVKVYAPVYGFPNYQPAEPDQTLEAGSILSFGETNLQIAFVPGHSPGHLAFINLDELVCLGGDVLFRESIGRTDLPGGNFDTLISSIQNVLFKLPDDCVVYPGHGPTTTIGYEKKSNPFCALKQQSE